LALNQEGPNHDSCFSASATDWRDVCRRESLRPLLHARVQSAKFDPFRACLAARAKLRRVLDTLR